MDLVKDKESNVTTCPWCHGSRHCAKCDGTGHRQVQTRMFHRTHTTDCRACEGTGVCQLCKSSN
jgi:DnaJ-class molecular chaperone